MNALSSYALLLISMLLLVQVSYAEITAFYGISGVLITYFVVGLVWLFLFVKVKHAHFYVSLTAALVFVGWHLLYFDAVMPWSHLGYLAGAFAAYEICLFLYVSMLFVEEFVHGLDNEKTAEYTFSWFIPNWKNG